MTTFLDKTRRPIGPKASLEELNAFFKPLPFQERIKAFYRLFQPEDVLMTSSFGTSSVFLLYWVKKFQKEQKIHFINTGYHFPETLAYKDQLEDLLDLDIIEVNPDLSKHQHTQKQQTWKQDVNQCCLINKLEPMALIKKKHQFWVSGVMGFQTPHRANLDIFTQEGDLVKFHPLVDIDEGEFLYFMSYLKLPEHPLAAFGYGSVGCTHCTVKGAGREGRWQGQQKTECGLHTGYFEKMLKKSKTDSGN